MIQKILIIIVSVSIFGLLLFVYVRNQIKKKIDFYLQVKNKKQDAVKTPTVGLEPTTIRLRA